MVCVGAGLFTGCFVSLFSVYALLAHLSGIFSPSTELDYMETVYPVFRYMLSFTIAFSVFYSHVIMYSISATITASSKFLRDVLVLQVLKLKVTSAKIAKCFSDL